MSSLKLNNEELAEKLFNSFKVPTWAAKPVSGLHLDVLKEGRLVQKLMIDEKKCYFFGRNRQLCDFPIDHESCSRVHAALVWHGIIARPFLIDLGSTHGTFIGHQRLEGHKPQQVPIDSEISFGASSRVYVIRERPQSQQFPGIVSLEEKEGSYLGLPQTETELDNLTEYNTAHNRRIASMLNAADPPPKKRKRLNVNFADEDDIINPEDVDPTVGRFRNLVHETFIPNKQARLGSHSFSIDDRVDKAYHSAAHGPADEEGTNLATAALSLGAFSVAAKLGLPLPNLAPDVDSYVEPQTPTLLQPVSVLHSNEDETPRKKKYAKEAWPGKRPGFLVAN